MYAPDRGRENPIIRRALDLCDQQGMKVAFHEDTVEVWFGPNNKRFYTIWSQFLADAEAIFGDRMHEQPEAAEAAPYAAPLHGTARTANGFGHRPRAFAEAAAAYTPAPASLIRTAPPAAANLPAAPPGDGEAEIRRLRAEVKLLERAIRVVGMQGEEWKREVEAARLELETSRAEMANMLGARAAPGGGPDRYKQVRQIIVRRLHPDVAGTDEEKRYREVLFKAIWSEIEGLDRK